MAKVSSIWHLLREVRELLRTPYRRSSQNFPSETVWKFSATCQAPHHEPYHCGVDERFRAGAKPLVVLAHPPVLAKPGKGPLHHPPARQGHVPSRRHKPLPVHLLSLLGPFLCPDLRHLLRYGLLAGLRTTSTLKPKTSSAHLLLLPSYPASNHRCFRRESPVRADSSRSLSPSWSGTLALCTFALRSKPSVSTSRCRFLPLTFLLPS
jgi:hypothetical protein